jgi:hypothetical protein
MKKINLEWVFFTVSGAILTTIAIELYKKHKAQKLELKNKAAIPTELLIIEKL